MIYRLNREQIVSAKLDDVWKYFATPQNLNEMTPKDMKFTIIHGGKEKMFQGQLIEYRVQFMPLFKSRWLTEIAHVEEKILFCRRATCWTIQILVSRTLFYIYGDRNSHS